MAPATQPETFAPEQIVSARDFQRSISGLLDKLEQHGSLLVLHHGKPCAVLKHAPVVEQPHTFATKGEEGR